MFCGRLLLGCEQFYGYMTTDSECYEEAQDTQQGTLNHYAVDEEEQVPDHEPLQVAASKCFVQAMHILRSGQKYIQTVFSHFLEQTSGFLQFLIQQIDVLLFYATLEKLQMIYRQKIEQLSSKKLKSVYRKIFNWNNKDVYCQSGFSGKTVINCINKLQTGRTLNYIIQKIVMNAPICTNCYEKYSESNPARVLNKCAHSFCSNCILGFRVCPVDNYPVEAGRNKLENFRMNMAIMRDLKKEPVVRRSTRVPSLGTSINPAQREQEQNRCLLHDKPLDVVCIDHLKKICSSCALFGDHKLHKVQTVDKVIADCSVVGEHALNILSEVMSKNEQTHQEAVLGLVNEHLKQRRDTLARNIRMRFKKLQDKIRKLETTSLQKLDQVVEMQRQQLLADVKLEDIMGKKSTWIGEAKKLIDLVENLTNDKHVEEAARYINQNCQESTIPHRGEYLLIEISSFQMNLTNKLQKYKDDILTQFDQTLEERLDNFLTVCRQTDKQPKPLMTEEKKVEPQGDVLLLQQGLSKEKKQEVLTPDTCQTFCRISDTISEVQPFTIVTEPEPEVTEVRQIQDNTILSGKDLPTASVAELRKKKKIKLPEKYEIVVEDLRNDKCETIDLGGAELGDAIIVQLCDYIRCTKKLKCLKLVRNKLSNDSLQAIVEACAQSNVTSLNLGQNLMTDSALDILDRLQLRELKSITLSQNKLKERTCKQKLIEFRKRGITLTI